MNDGDQSRRQPAAESKPQPQPGRVQGQATLPRDIAREALQQSLDRRW